MGQTSGLGAGLDSFYEYLLKVRIMTSFMEYITFKLSTSKITCIWVHVGTK